MIKLLIGGSPCTYWSIAQKNNRETEAAQMAEIKANAERFKTALAPLTKDGGGKV